MNNKTYIRFIDPTNLSNTKPNTVSVMDTGHQNHLLTLYSYNLKHSNLTTKLL